MVPERVLMSLENWRPEFESDSIIKARDRARRCRDIRYVRDIFHEIADQLGLEAISFGSCRMAFGLSPHRVLKVGFSRFGMWANLLEAEASQELPEDLHARVYDWAPDGLWLIQERVDISGIDMRRRGARHLRDRLEQAFGMYVNDFHSRNVGRRADGTLVIVDLEFLSKSSWPVDTPDIRRYLKF